MKLLCVEQNVPRNLNIFIQANIIPAVKEENPNGSRDFLHFAGAAIWKADFATRCKEWGHPFFAANMERKLRLLFAPEYGWALDYDFDLGELVVFPRFPDITVIQ